MSFSEAPPNLLFPTAIFSLGLRPEGQGRRTRNIHEDSIFYHHEISQLSSRESRKSRRRRVASLALVGVRRVFSAGWHTQALARVICEIREIRVKFNHLCVKILVRLPCLKVQAVKQIKDGASRMGMQIIFEHLASAPFRASA